MTSGAPEPDGPAAGANPKARINRRFVVAIALVAILVAGGVAVAVKPSVLGLNGAHGSGGVVQVVAAQNFWGSLVAQIGGTHVHVLSVVSDPNADPHEYTSNASTARSVATAQYVVVNGAGYDNWALQLISAGTISNQVVLNVADLLGKSPGVNPHFWYNPSYVNLTVHQMLKDLTSIDPADAGYFQQQFNALEQNLGAITSRIAEIHAKFANVPVASTESVFVYLANATGLNLVSPPEFMNAVAEGIDPPAQSVVTFQNQLSGGNVSILVYNAQTVTPLTDQMKQIAAQHNIPIVAVTETIQPPAVTYQFWMAAELVSLENALNQQAPGI